MKILPIVSPVGIGLLFVSFMLLFFILQQIYYISKNLTQIELDKYEEVEYTFKIKGINKPISNFYNKGLINNWKEFLFPPKIHLHEPFKLKIE